MLRSAAKELTYLLCCLGYVAAIPNAMAFVVTGYGESVAAAGLETLGKRSLPNSFCMSFLSVTTNAAAITVCLSSSVMSSKHRSVGLTAISLVERWHIKAGER